MKQLKKIHQIRKSLLQLSSESSAYQSHSEHTIKYKGDVQRRKFFGKVHELPEYMGSQKDNSSVQNPDVYKC
jgi:hypothetical protein